MRSPIEPMRVTKEITLPSRQTITVSLDFFPFGPAPVRFNLGRPINASWLPLGARAQGSYSNAASRRARYLDLYTAFNSAAPDAPPETRPEL